MGFPIERIRIANSGLTNTIYIGRTNAKGDKWLDKREATDEALEAVRDHLFALIPEGDTTGGYEWGRKDGKVVRLTLTIDEKAEAAE